MKSWNKMFLEPELLISTEERQNASYVRKCFMLEKSVQKAVLYTTACGVYKAFLNGKEVDNQILLPGLTDYSKRLQYQKYDVTEQLQLGKNVICAEIGDGWYRGRVGLAEKIYYYGKKIKFFCFLQIEYKDGTKQEIKSDCSWKATQDGPIRKNDLKTGEEYDATREMHNWKDIDYDDSLWHGVCCGEYTGELVPSEGEPVLEQEHFWPTVIQTPDGNTILDFGQNLSGYVKFKVKGPENHKVRLVHGETLDENGNFTLKNLEPEGSDEMDQPFGQMIDYKLKEGYQEYKPTFAHCGFQYVKLENWPEEVKAENFEAIAVYSDIRVNGEFECSNEWINRLVENVKWSQRSNFVDIPTDCPTRERTGWTGDISIFGESACYLSDPKKFILKWLEDVRLEQREDGAVSYMVPDFGLMDEAYGSAGWQDVIYTLPWTLYQFYGEKEILEKYYDSIRCLVDFNQKRALEIHDANKNRTERHRKFIIDTGFHFGEWLEPGSVMIEDVKTAIEHPDEEVATAYFGYSAKILSKIAGILHKEDDERKYDELYRNICEAYQKEFLKNGHVVSDRQCRFVRPVALDLVTESEKRTIVKDLNKKIIANEYKIGTGFLTTASILPILTEYGYIETAYKMLENTKQPGWLYAVTKGATTIWENWIGKDEKNVPRDSMNHYAPGSVVAWLFNTVAGIRPLKPGFELIKIKPLPGGSLQFANASIQTCKGKVVSSWKIESDRFLLHVEVPETAQIYMPDGSVCGVSAGKHDFSCAYQ